MKGMMKGSYSLINVSSLESWERNGILQAPRKLGRPRVPWILAQRAPSPPSEGLLKGSTFGVVINSGDCREQ